MQAGESGECQRGRGWPHANGIPRQSRRLAGIERAQILRGGAGVSLPDGARVAAAIARALARMFERTGITRRTSAAAIVRRPRGRQCAREEKNDVEQQQPARGKPHEREWYTRQTGAGRSLGAHLRRRMLSADLAPAEGEPRVRRRIPTLQKGIAGRVIPFMPQPTVNW